MNTYIEKLDSAVGGRRNVARLADVFRAPSAAAPGAMVVSHGPTLPAFMRSGERDVPDGLGTILGAVAGGYLFRSSHPYLGIIGGASLGRNLPVIMRSADRGPAWRNVITTGGGVAGAKLMPNRPILGFLLGAAVAGFGAHMKGLR
jgi:hypothetical protein